MIHSMKARAVFIFIACTGLAMPSVCQTHPRAVHVYVALADNEHQGIIPAPAKLANGKDPAHNLYWGASFGVKTFFKNSEEWELLWSGPGPKPAVLERCIFKHRTSDVYLVADAYEGSLIRDAVTDFLSAAAGLGGETVSVKNKAGSFSIPTKGAVDLVVYVGHDAFMDFQIEPAAGRNGGRVREAIILACASKAYFAPYLEAAGADPLLWTRGLMAPEAYSLKAALDGWMRGEDGNAIRERSAQAYSKYQKCTLQAARNLFATGW